jgi:hypothetical protein
MRALLLIPIAAAALFAQDRPGLFFREDWKESPPETPATQQHVVNPDLVLALYGPGREGVKKSNHDKPADDPFYIWTGTCDGNCAVTLRHKSAFADLTGQSKIAWRSKQSGFRTLRMVVKLAGGQWLVSDLGDDASLDWRVREFNVQDIRWRRLDIKNVVEGQWVDKPDLSRVDEIGFTDLMTGGQSIACSRLDWIEVWAKPVKR